MAMAIELSNSGMEAGKGGPFGWVIVKDGKIIGIGSNVILESNDPTAHAEIVAIREACKIFEKWKLKENKTLY
ncbi:nucleoside deaminase [Shivajiella indica]|uniref:Nucleoside deaminase n=1 Tax=Shivajiella indica TaxID=872115 RepID=A0ABW5B8E5_9BACT